MSAGFAGTSYAASSKAAVSAQSAVASGTDAAASGIDAVTLGIDAVASGTDAHGGSVLSAAASAAAVTGKLTAADINKTSSSTLITTPSVSASGKKSFQYTLKMPVKGTLIIKYGNIQGASSSIGIEGKGVSYAGSGVVEGAIHNMYYVTKTGSFTMTVSVYANKNNPGAVWFTALYALPGNTLPKNKSSYTLGSLGSKSVSTFKVSIPSNGYLQIQATGMLKPSEDIYLRAAGFKKWEPLNADKNAGIINIGVKKGKYTISLKGAAAYKLSLKFVKVKETSAKTSKKKAAKIKKNKFSRGLIPTNSNTKVHWYKIVNPKTQKMSIFIGGKKTSPSSGTLKITVYTPNGKAKTVKHTPGTSKEYPVVYGSQKKAKKGTYYIKVAGSGGANGYYTLKWK